MDPETLQELLKLLGKGSEFNLGMDSGYQPSGMSFGRQGPRPQFPSSMFNTPPFMPLNIGGYLMDSPYLMQPPRFMPPRIQWGVQNQHTGLSPLASFPMFRPGYDQNAPYYQLPGDASMGDWFPMEQFMTGNEDPDFRFWGGSY